MADDLADARLEREIKQCEARLDAAWKALNREAAVREVSLLCELVSRRSPEQVERMERERGLQ